MDRRSEDGFQQHKGANAFDPMFLATFEAIEDPPASVTEAEFAGPWRVVATPRGHAVLRDGETTAEESEVLCEDRYGALLAAAVLPAVGRDALYRLESDRGTDGRFEIRMPWGQQGERPAGSLRLYVPEVTNALHVASWLVRSPASLAVLLEAAGATVLARAGMILSRRVEERERLPADLLERVGEVLGISRLSPRDRERLEEMAEEWGQSLEVVEDPLPRVARCLAAAAETLRRTGVRLQALSEDSDTLRRSGSVPAAYLADLAGTCGTLALDVARRLGTESSPGDEELEAWRRSMEEVDERMRREQGDTGST